MKGCTKAYVTGMAAGVEEGATTAYCSLMHRYKQCTDDLSSNKCRGDLQYHSTHRMISSVMGRFNCTHILAEDPQHQVLPQSPSVAPTDAHDECQYPVSSTPAPAHCGLFGDPHLKTFNDSYMTCGVVGAWPLLNTPYLAIQVTNEPVGPANHATATTKVSTTPTDHGYGPCPTAYTSCSYSTATPLSHTLHLHTVNKD
ncbi:repulsive guidance molecule A-like [Homarus americanus]|uniref:repulsive guidance molecule A-like n=1 Tax=Homarus americanus TaxID=6706 RepID=UPI001C448334|nr:repulsive guidance molecule A-like [Homarus americanus]